MPALSLINIIPAWCASYHTTSAGWFLFLAVDGVCNIQNHPCRCSRHTGFIKMLFQRISLAGFHSLG